MEIFDSNWLKKIKTMTFDITHSHCCETPLNGTRDGYYTIKKATLTMLDTIIASRILDNTCIYLAEYIFYHWTNPDAYTEHCQISKMELFDKTIKLVTIFAKRSILDTWQGSKYASAIRVSKVVHNLQRHCLETQNFIQTLEKLTDTQYVRFCGIRFHFLGTYWVKWRPCCVFLLLLLSRIMISICKLYEDYLNPL